ncbi:hypothetical protein N4T20_08760 [Flavobacterium sp. TR2]|uniref:hypothetical protein n=1 Tax=Flavobacterium sp. TR2 TaxID=2977321 RepID=UPI0021B12303|nr:hypothetical protein [Flavobacterium sp. TR2]UWY30021.1 hypothetical protein N4T20_08760 [Flavobacterium sp. TR2]
MRKEEIGIGIKKSDNMAKQFYTKQQNQINRNNLIQFISVPAGNSKSYRIGK